MVMLLNFGWVLRPCAWAWHMNTIPISLSQSVDEVQKGITPNLLVRNWPPALPEWNTRAVRDAFYASPLFPRLLDPEASNLVL